MIVVYADGGGLGHLTRIQAVRHTLGLEGPVSVLTATHHAEDGRVTAGVRVIAIPDRRDDLEARRSWLQRTVRDLAPSLVVVDAFPAGLAGEIDAATVPTGVPTMHLARLLRWSAYRRVLPDRPLRFGQTFLLEALDDEHHRHLAASSDLVTPLVLTDPRPSAIEAVWPARATTHDGRPRWLVTHAGPAPEVAELIAYARDQAAAEGVDPLLVVATPAGAAPPTAPDIVHLDRYPVWPLFGTADRIVTAAGFNAMRQLAPHRGRHRFLAMPRRYDDQIERARRAREPAALHPA